MCLDVCFQTPPRPSLYDAYFHDYDKYFILVSGHGDKKRASVPGRSIFLIYTTIIPKVTNRFSISSFSEDAPFIFGQVMKSS